MLLLLLLQAKVLECFCPDPAAFADAAEVIQAKTFAQILMDNPPMPEFTEFLQQQQQQQGDSASNLLVRLWLIWATNGHSFRLGSALLYYSSRLKHTCSAPNTAYRTAAGDLAAVHALAAGSSGSSSNAAGMLPPTAAAAGAAAAAAAGYHVAMGDIKEGDVLYTNYLGLGHKRLMSTLVRQKILQEKFLYKCDCTRWALVFAQSHLCYVPATWV